MAGSGIEIRFNKLPKLPAHLRQEAADETARAAHALEAQEKQIVVEKNIIDTSFLLNSIQAQQQGEMEWVVGNGAEYSPHQNYGTINQPARPFVEPAVAIIKPQYIDAMKKLVGELGR